MGPKSILSDEEEAFLERWILGKAAVGFPMHPDEVKDAVQHVLKEAPRDNPFEDDRPGTKWMALFLKRHPEIKKKNTEVISKARACVTEERIRQWFADVKSFLRENNFLDVLDRPRSIFNGDETGVQTCPKSGLVLGPKSEKNFYEIANGSEKESITVLCTFSAAGDAVPPMIVFPYKRIPAHIAETVPDDWAIGRSDSGWMVQATFFEYIANVFYPWCVENQVVFPVIYFLDGHKSHISPELREFCIKHNIILYCLAPNSTHIKQPCDVGVFKPLKTNWKIVSREHKQLTQKAVTKSNFTPLFKKAFDRLMVNQTIIQNAFRASGLYPFDADAVDYSKCISTRRANFFKEPDNFSPSLHHFTVTKEMIEYFIGPKRTESYVEKKNMNVNLNSSNHLFLLWNLCSNRLEGLSECADQLPSEIADIQSEIHDFPTHQSAATSRVEDNTCPLEQASQNPSTEAGTSDTAEDSPEPPIVDDVSCPSGESADPPIEDYVSCPVGESPDFSAGLHEDTPLLFDENDLSFPVEESIDPRTGFPMYTVVCDGHEEISTIDDFPIRNYSHGQPVSSHGENNNYIIIDDASDENGNFPGPDASEVMINKNNNNIVDSVNNNLETNESSHQTETSTIAEQKESRPDEPKPSRGRRNQSVLDLWNKHTSWPDGNLTKSTKSKKDNQQPMPFAITSKQWGEYQDKKKKEQLEKEQQTANRVKMRQLKKESIETEKQRKRDEKEEKAKAQGLAAKERIKVKKERVPKLKKESDSEQKLEKTTENITQVKPKKRGRPKKMTESDC